MFGEKDWKIRSPVEPHYNTWGVKSSTGVWYLCPEVTIDSSSFLELNGWIADSFMILLTEASTLMRPWLVSFSTISDPTIDPISLEWRVGDSLDDYLSRVRGTILNYPAPIYSLEALVDLFAYCCTADSPQRPICNWIRLHDKLHIWSGSNGGERVICFEVNHSLFCPSSEFNEDNRELHLLNQPLLEQTLRRWEQRFGPICDVEGLLGVYEYGFDKQE